MRISRRRRRRLPDKPVQIRYRVNTNITVPEVRLVDENDENVGVVSTTEALTRARSMGLDLVEVSPKANPPVAKILDYSKLKYQESKESRKQKSKKVEIKGVRLTFRMGTHDREMRMKQAQKFLQAGDKVKIELNLRGRERQHRDLARQHINEFVTALNKLLPTKIEQPLVHQGSKLLIQVAKGQDKSQDKEQDKKPEVKVKEAKK
ncbi:translation initiation factor IF-3 [bacterium]|nr:translation initiation factor IF-3 [bacterium]